MPPPIIPILQSTKYASAWFEHGHPFNDAAYSLVQDAPMMAVKVTRYEEVLKEMESALAETRAHLQRLVEAGKVEPAQLSHVEAALGQLHESRRDLELEPA
jgi:DNA repair ATPase RecN